MCVDIMSFGRTARRWREQRGWSRERLASEITEKYGVESDLTETIKRFENGHNTTMRSFILIFAALVDQPHENLESFLFEALDLIREAS